MVAIKKVLITNILTFLFIAAFSTAARASAELAKIDTSRASDGLIVYQYGGDTSGGDILAIIQKEGGGNDHYPFEGDTVVLPLSGGAGTYKAYVALRMDGGQARPLLAESVTVTAIDETEMFMASTAEVNYAASTEAIPAYENMAGTLENPDKIKTVYDDLVMNYAYDYELAESVMSGAVKSYRPVIDQVYRAKKGICYGYSAVLAGALRSQGVPVKLVKGYASAVDTYHAWNEILIDGEWVIVDSTSDAAYYAGGAEYTFAKDNGDYQADREF